MDKNQCDFGHSVVICTELQMSQRHESDTFLDVNGFFFQYFDHIKDLNLFKRVEKTSIVVMQESYET